MKKQEKPAGSSVTKAILKPILKESNQNTVSLLKPTVGNTPLKPAALYQDDGSGYNLNLVDPQE